MSRYAVKERDKTRPGRVAKSILSVPQPHMSPDLDLPLRALFARALDAASKAHSLATIQDATQVGESQIK